MNGLDCIVFTAGIGENSELMRGLICADMDVFGIELDESANSSYSNGVSDISKKNSKVKILIIPTNEELEIARQIFNLFNKE